MPETLTPPRPAGLRRLWRAFAYLDDPDLSPRHGRAVLIMAAFAPVASISLWGYAVFYVLHDWQNLWLASVSCTIAGFAFLGMPSFIRRNAVFGSYVLLVIGSVLFTLLCYFFGGSSGLNLGFFTGCILAMLILGTGRPGHLALICGPAILLALATPLMFREAALPGVTPDLMDMIYRSNVLALLGLTALALFLSVRQVEIAETALAAEHARSEALLTNLLPEAIAQRLKAAPGEIIADELPQVTILFADIVDFTPRATRMPPEALVGFLNRIFSEFDRLAAQHGLEKIKTIGDAYMVAAGMPVPRADHAQAVAGMALDMLAATDRLSAAMQDRIEVRIGLHSGPATAGVIGTSKVFYDVWGTTVNTASRLESHGVAGRIQVTGPTRDLLAESYAFSPRGTVKIKGIGPVETFWLEGPRV